MSLSSSPRLNSALSSIGIVTPVDVLNHLPRRYENFDLSPYKRIYEDKERLVKRGIIDGKIKSVRFRNHSLTSFYLCCEGESFLVEAWNRPYLAKILKSEEEYTITGVYEAKRHSLSLVFLVKGKVAIENHLRPIYSLPNDIPNHVFSSLVKRCLILEKGQLGDVVPSYFSKKYRLLSHYEALTKVHEPLSLDDIHAGLRVLKYEEALMFSLKNAIVKGENRAIKKDRRRVIDREKLKVFISSLPFSLSPDQTKVIAESLSDMDSPNVMYRLLQGDVGTGKTLVAAILAYANHLRSEQSALLAPTMRWRGNIMKPLNLSIREPTWK
jgi:ATP-dependent DNA helicase RecG